MLLTFSIGLLRGAKMLVSQAIRGKARRRGRAYLAAAVVSSFAIGLVTIVFGQVIASPRGRLTASEAAAIAAARYLRIRSLGAPLVLLYVALREVRYADGDARSPTIATLAAHVANIVLAGTFVFGLLGGS